MQGWEMSGWRNSTANGSDSQLRHPPSAGPALTPCPPSLRAGRGDAGWPCL